MKKNVMLYLESDAVLKSVLNMRLMKQNCAGLTPTGAEIFYSAEQYPGSDCFEVLPVYGYFIRHAENIVFSDYRTIVALPDGRETFSLVNARGIAVNGKELNR